MKIDRALTQMRRDVTCKRESGRAKREERGQRRASGQRALRYCAVAEEMREGGKERAIRANLISVYQSDVKKKGGSLAEALDISQNKQPILYTN